MRELTDSFLLHTFGTYFGWGRASTRAPQGALPTTLDSRSIHELKPLTKEEQIAVYSAALRANPLLVTLTVVDRTTGGIRSTVSSRGQHQSGKHAPPVLNLDLSSPAIGGQ